MSQLPSPPMQIPKKNPTPLERSISRSGCHREVKDVAAVGMRREVEGRRVITPCGKCIEPLYKILTTLIYIQNICIFACLQCDEALFV